MASSRPTTAIAGVETTPVSRRVRCFFCLRIFDSSKAVAIVVRSEDCHVPDFSDSGGEIRYPAGLRFPPRPAHKKCARDQGYEFEPWDWEKHTRAKR